MELVPTLHGPKIRITGAGLYTTGGPKIRLHTGAMDWAPYSDVFLATYYSGSRTFFI